MKLGEWKGSDKWDRNATRVSGRDGLIVQFEPMFITVLDLGMWQDMLPFIREYTENNPRVLWGME